MENEPPGPDGESAPPGLPVEVFQALSDAVAGGTRAVFLTEAARTRTLLLLWDAVVADETERGLTVAPDGKAERAFTGHLAGLLHVSRNRAITLLHASLGARAMPVSFGLFETGAYGWQSMEAVVRHLGAPRGDARERYDLEAGRLAAESVPQLLDAALSRLHDRLDHDDATETAAAAHRQRRLRARPGDLDAGILTLTGPQADIAAIYETAQRLAVAAHGLPGETRTMDQLRYDCTVDVILHGFATPVEAMQPVLPVDPDAEPRAPSTPFERLGDPRVPGRKSITAEILVTVPATTAIGVTDQPGVLLGWGSLSAAEVRRAVAAARSWTRAEIDPIDDAILGFDSHRRTIPTALRRLIWMRADTCDEPGCTAPAHLADMDHVIRVEHGGRTVEVNLTALCRRSHQDKDDGYVDLVRSPDGDIDWRTTRWGGRKTKKATIVIRRRPAPQPADDPAPWDRAA